MESFQSENFIEKQSSFIFNLTKVGYQRMSRVTL